MTRLSIAQTTALVAAALRAAGAGNAMAEATARAPVLADSQGLGSHGLSRLARYMSVLTSANAPRKARTSKKHCA